MAKCLVKSIVLYFIIITMMLFIKPHYFYYDNNKTKLKPWDLYKDTQLPIDIINLYTSILILSIICFITGNTL